MPKPAPSLRDRSLRLTGQLTVSKVRIVPADRVRVSVAQKRRAPLEAVGTVSADLEVNGNRAIEMGMKRDTQALLGDTLDLAAQ